MHLWVLSDPLIRMENPKEQDDKDPFISGELNPDDILVQKFFVKEQKNQCIVICIQIIVCYYVMNFVADELFCCDF